ncbi:TlyA family RNA methyltransferase [Granulicoccus sp. GXG6511]|uniref:TlyA family RNA methyltransferase n=1 Tax=Granulicoccus sp. GXG6511 TaxID=3381351 RepID=UPI003D7D4EAB
MTVRLDTLLVDRGLARSRSQAATLVREGRVRVGGVTVRKPATAVPPQADLDVDVDPWVSRAAHKLLGALDDLGIAVPDRVLDAGSSTGGFTQVLLSRGAKRVFAVDVGTDQLAAQLRDDPRVSVHEQTNLRDLTLAHVDGEPVDLVVADVSFISLTLLLAPLLAVLDSSGAALLMVKPQFEVGRELLGKGGVVRDPAQRAAAVATVSAAAEALGWRTIAEVASKLPGPAGNVEYFLHLRSAHLC